MQKYANKSAFYLIIKLRAAEIRVLVTVVIIVFNTRFLSILFDLNKITDFVNGLFVYIE